MSYSFVKKYDKILSVSTVYINEVCLSIDIKLYLHHGKKQNYVADFNYKFMPYKFVSNRVSNRKNIWSF